MDLGDHKWISRLDDFGASKGTNQAILDIVDAGYAKNVGVMIPCAYPTYKLEELLERSDRIDIGLHATMNSEWDGIRWGPVSEPASVPGLTRADGTFHPDPSNLLEQTSVEAVMAETAAQLDQARKLKIPCDYIDTHMVWARFPEVVEALSAFCAKEGIVFGNSKRFGNFKWKVEGSKDTSAEAIAAAVNEHTTSKTFICVHHPAIRDAVSERFYHGEKSTTVADNRHREWEMLADPALAQTIEDELGIQLIRYSEVRD